MTHDELNRVADGDPVAIRAFLDRFNPILLGVVRSVRRRWLWPAHEEEDLLQHVQIELLRDRAAALTKWDRNGGRSLENFLRIFARNRSIDQLRRDRRELPTDETALGHLNERRSAPSYDGGGLDWLDHALVRYRAECTDVDWQFLERFVSGHENEELCEWFRLTPAAAYKRISRLRQRLLQLQEEFQLRAG